MTWSLVLDHLFLVLAASVLSIAIGILLGIVAYLVPGLRQVILRIVDIFQTIPALALLGMIMILVGPGKLTVIIGITLYSLLPIVQNTYLGLKEIDPGVKEAAKGVGMTRFERIVKVEFPLAFPTIYTGIRLAIVNAIGTAVFAAFVGGGGIGGVMNRAIRTQNMKMILIATGILMLIAAAFDLIMSLSESWIRKSHDSMKRIVLALCLILVLFGATIPFEAANSTESTGLIMYDGDYTEVQLMHRMMRDVIEDRTDLNVTIKDQMSQVNNYKALIGDNHACDLMLSYDGTLLTTFLHKDPKDVPKNETLFDYANALGTKQEDVSLVGKIGFNNTYAIAVPKAVAEKYNLKKVSDLKAVANQLTFGAEHEFFTAEGSMKYGPFCKYYGLNFKNRKSVDVSLKYSAIEKGEFEVTEVYATDGLNIKAGLVILEDDKHFFPEYNGSILVRNDIYSRFSDKAPNLKKVLQTFDGLISTEEMANLTYQVDVEGKDLDDVAHAFLVKKGVLKK